MNRTLITTSRWNRKVLFSPQLRPSRFDHFFVDFTEKEMLWPLRFVDILQVNGRSGSLTSGNLGWDILKEPCGNFRRKREKGTNNKNRTVDKIDKIDRETARNEAIDNVYTGGFYRHKKRVQKRVQNSLQTDFCQTRE